MMTDGSSSRSSLPSGAIPPKEEREEVRLLKFNKKRDDAICFLILSGLFSLLFAFFLALSFRYNFLREKHFVPASLEFVLCIVFACLFLAFLAIGTVKFVLAQRRIVSLAKEKR